METRPATLADAPAFHRIATTLQLEGRSLDQAQDSGFFLYVGSVEHYARTIAASPYCYAAIEDGECRGFLTTMLPAVVAEFPAKRSREMFVKDGRYPLVLEQIGVAREYQGRGAGQQMLNRLLADCPEPRMVATVIHQPVRNVRSIRFLEKNGWRAWREVHTGKRVWGFYEWQRY